MVKYTQGVEIEGLQECLKAFNRLEKEVRKNANGELRKASKEIASQIKPRLGGSGAPVKMEREILDAARPKADRYVVVKVPGVVPGLSGLNRKKKRLAPQSDKLVSSARRANARTARRSKMSIIWPLEKGSSYPQFHNPTPGGVVANKMPRLKVWAEPKYLRVLESIMRKYGLI